jgi:hypothetical protein
VSFEVVMFTGDVGIEADQVEILESDEKMVVVKAWFLKPEQVTADTPPLPDPRPSPDTEDPGPSDDQIDYSELPDLPVLVDA